MTIAVRPASVFEDVRTLVGPKSPASTEVASAAWVNPARSKFFRIPAYAIVRSTLASPLSSGYASIAGAPWARANSTAPEIRVCEIPSPR